LSADVGANGPPGPSISPLFFEKEHDSAARQLGGGAAKIFEEKARPMRGDKQAGTIAQEIAAFGEGVKVAPIK
jgi:hypothetical protein